MARKTVSTTGNSSGSMDMPSAMPASTPSSHPPRVSPYSSTVSVMTMALAIANIVTRRRVCSCSRGVSVSSVRRDCPILPISVRIPVDVTSAMPLPRTTSVPENTKGRSSPPVCGGPASVSGMLASLRTGTDSPVSSDSSSSRSSHCTTVASAATRSPSESTIRSPRTTSRPAMRTRSPSRITSARGLVRSRSDSSTRSVRASCTMVMRMEIDANTMSRKASP